MCGESAKSASSCGAAALSMFHRDLPSHRTSPMLHRFPRRNFDEIRAYFNFSNSER